MRAAPLGRLSSLLLPALALAAVAGLIWLTPADSAQAQTTVWSATLTVSGSGNGFGCDLDTQGISPCSSQLSNGNFTYKGTTYTVKQAHLSLNPAELFIWFDDGGSKTGGQNQKALQKLTLNVDGTELKVKNAKTSTSGNIYWDYDPSMDWSVGQTVSLSLTGPGTSSATSAYAPSVWVESVDYASSPPNGSYYRAGETIAVAVNFSGPVTAKSKNMWLYVDIGGVRETLYLHAGSGTDRWVFTEVVHAGLSDSDGFTLWTTGTGRWVGMTVRTANKYGPTVSFDLKHTRVKINTQYQSRQVVKGGETVPVPNKVDSVTCNGSGTHCTVPYNWKYAPKSLKKKPGASFRLMYVTASEIQGTSDNVSAYNSLAQSALPSGDWFNNFSTSIRAMVNAVNGDDLRTNTRTRLNSGDQRADPGAFDPIFWVKGKKVADSYADLFDGSWDSSKGTSAKVTNENGVKLSTFVGVWTGSNQDGSPDAGPGYDYRLGTSNPRTANAVLKGDELDGESLATATALDNVYAITPLLTVASKE